MKTGSRTELLRKAKPLYVVYWHHLESDSVPEIQGYVGVTKTNSFRFSTLLESYKKNEKFISVISKYGEENIITSILYDGLSKEEAEKLEYKLRPEADIGWNIRQGGGNKAKHSNTSNDGLISTSR